MIETNDAIVLGLISMILPFGEFMNIKYLTHFISDKIILAMISLLIVVSYISYQKGLSNGFVPKEELCETEILNLETCNGDMIELQKQHVEDLVKCNTECKLNTCKPICTKQTSEALESYKKLTKELKCGDLK
jgi:hypothetical protein